MSGDESFLARWSRRKRAVAAQADLQKSKPSSAAEIAQPISATTREAPPAVPLPPIESIEAASDIKAFLAPGVPLELTRAALRRAWTADPVIRDFIGLSENAWDFNAPDGVLGFGPLDLQEIRRLAAQGLGEPKVADPSPASPAEGAAKSPEAALVPPTEPPESIAAAHHEEDEKKAPQSRVWRHHGGALPNS